MQLKIDNLKKKTINTSRGDSESLSIQCGGQWYGAWAGKWNEHWKVGITIDIPDSRVERKQSGDRAFLNITAPPRDEGSSGSAGAADPDTLQRILNGLVAIHNKLQEHDAKLAEILKAVKGDF